MSLNELNIKEWIKERENFELLIDVRSPSEYAYSHIKNALNLYALNDKEHKEVGTIYKSNKSLAKVLGARYICANLDRHLEKIYKNHRVGAMVGVYCARGGMRSLAISQVLCMIGYRVVRLIDGYKAYRNHVQENLQKPLNARFVTLFGNTGSYKTKLIQNLKPAINLEALANHLGSVFGSIAGKQPSQKAFEDELFEELLSLGCFDENFKTKTIFAEGESRRIGSLTLPATLHEALRNGVIVEVVASLDRRIECIMSDYKSVNSEFFYDCMKKITPFISKEARMDAINAFETKDIAKVCEILLTKYYDKVYKKPSRVDYQIYSDDLESAKANLCSIAKFN